MKKNPHEEQSQEAKQKSEAERKAWLDDLRSVLSSQSGYNVVFGVLRYTKLFESIWSPSAEIHKNAGRQEVGNWLFGEVVQASPDALIELVNGIKRDQAAEKNREMEEKK